MDVHANISFLFILTICVTSVHTYKILILASDGGSHVLFNGRLAENLVERGHRVTLVTGSTQRIPNHLKVNPGITLESFFNPLQPLPTRSEYTEPLMQAALTGAFQDRLNSINKAMDMNIEHGLTMWNDTAFISRIQRAGFDFVVSDFIIPPFLIMPYKLGVPYAYLGADCRPFWRRLFYAPSHIPEMMTTFTDKMTFLQRSLNALAYVFEFVAFSGISANTREIVSKYVPEKPTISYDDLISRADLCITLRENMIDFIKPTMPDVVSMATLLTKPAEPLPDDLELYLTDAQEGVILVTFGSWLDILPDDIMQKLLTGFSQINYQVLFKYGKKINLEIPSNVKILPWVPQNDLLGHKNIKLFITHCGLNGLIESTYHGVPMLAFPLGLDQIGNAVIAKSKHIAEILTVHDFTADELVHSIRKLIDDKSYRKNAQLLSAALKDLAKSGTVNPAFWIEHVIKYGSNHIRPIGALQLHWYQYLLLDTIFVIILMSTMFCFCSYKLLVLKCKRNRSLKTKYE